MAETEEERLARLGTAAGETYGNEYGGYTGGSVNLDPTVAGPSGSYVGHQGGGVTTGSRDAIEYLTGVNKSTVAPALQATLPDAGDVAAVNAANEDYKQKQQEYYNRAKELADIIKREGPISKAGAAAVAEYKALAASPPPKPDLLSIQHQSDRNRLLNIGLAGYRPLIQDLQAASAGRGPSIAVDTYRQTADDASKRNYGLAASSKGTGGQRAALMQAALGQNAMDSQGAARQAGIMRAQEQQQARANLMTALAGQTNVFGTANLLGDTTNTAGRNQDAENTAIGVNAGIADENAKAGSGTVKDLAKTGGRVGVAVASSGTSEAKKAAEDAIDPND